MLALCSISRQGNQEKVGEESTQRLQIDALPGYATKGGIVAKKCYRTKYRLFALNRLVRESRCQDMLKRRSLKVGKIDVAPSAISYLALLIQNFIFTHLQQKT